MSTVRVFAVIVPALLIVACQSSPTAPSSTISGSGNAASVPVGSNAGNTVATATAVGPAVAEPGVCVPFKVNGSAGSVEIAGGPPPAPLEITLSAGGHATHLGQYSSSAIFVVTFPSPTVAVFDGGGTFTAANGDEVRFEYSGDFFPGSPAGGFGDYQIVGGTGRFEGATGIGVFSSEGGSTTFDGDICFAR